MPIPKKMGVGVAWWHPEEIPYTIRSKRIWHPSHDNDNSEKMV
jgi:hypothetical protein